MKTYLTRFALTASLLAFTVSAMAQDIIVLRSGDLIQSKIQEITPTEVKYKKFSNPDGPLYTILKNTVLAINYGSGEKETFGDATPAKTTVVETAPTTVDFSISAEENEALKKKYDVEVDYNDENKEKELNKDKEAKSFYCQLGFCKGSQLADKNIEVQITHTRLSIGKNPFLRDDCCNNQGLLLTIRNKTNKVMFIDLANCFFIRGNEAQPYFVPTSTSSTTGGQTGVGVNLGSVASALGVGGVIGTLANGVNVGGSKIHSETTTTYSQRIVSIPPMSEKKLDPMLIITEKGSNLYGLSARTYLDKTEGVCYFFKKIGLRRGETRFWEETDSPVKISTFITYSFDETLESVYNVRTLLYAKKMIALPRYLGVNSTMPTANIRILTNNWRTPIFFIGQFQ